MRMITSVSILLRRIGAATAETFLNGFGMSAPHGPDVGDGAGDCGSGRACRACQMRARTRPLAADKIAVRGRDRALPRRHHLAIGGKAHRAAGFAPFKAGVGKDLVEP